MTHNQFAHISLILVLPLLVGFSSIASDGSVEETLKVARAQFYTAIEDEKRIAPTIALFKQIAEVEPEYVGRAQVYIGALVALKGKHAFFPHTKLKWANRGLAIMDSGLQKSPNDVEALFIHGTTCYHLPFFFQRGDDAQRDFKEIVKRMPLQIHTYDPKLIANIVAFLLEKARLTNDEKTYLLALRDGLESQDSVVYQ